MGALDKFYMNLKEFYRAGKTIFLSSKGNIGVEETFYMHTLTHSTYEIHRCGVGVFNMQGFERRNIESKNYLKRFVTPKGNIVVNNMKRVYNIFNHKMNAV